MRVFLIASVCLTRAALVPDMITVETGDVLGVRNTVTAVRRWLGLPFASTTEGAGAWAAPTRRAPWSTPLNATDYAAGCYSSNHNPDTAPIQSFDCLNANIWAPVVAAGEQVPIMVFLYGGAYSEGDNQGPFDIYSGAHYAATQRVAVVALGYRLGAFGWLAALDGSGIDGNYGLMDQIAGLQWVQRNSAAFGGNASAVTVFGESAGAMSIGILMTLPAAKGLFHQAIMESNVGGFDYPNKTHAQVYSATFCGLLNCTLASRCDPTCLRAQPPHAIMSAWSTATGNVVDFILTDLGHILDGLLGTGPVVDGSFVPVEPQEAVQSGNFWAAGMPVLLGTNTNEGETFIYDGVPALPNFLAPAAYLGIFGFNESIAAAIDARPRYNYTQYDDARVPLSHVVTDYWFRCADEKFLISPAATGNAFAYRYNHVYSNASIFPTFGLPEICATVVCHASELPFVFHNVPNFTTFTPAESAFADGMVAYWAQFAKTGNPNADPANPTWPAWDLAGRKTLVLNTSGNVVERSDECEALRVTTRAGPAEHAHCRASACFFRHLASPSPPPPLRPLLAGDFWDQYDYFF